MKLQNDFSQLCFELLQIVGPVTYKRMFGGVGFFLDGGMFALIADNTLYFKVDDSTQSLFVEEGLTPFTYVRKGKSIALRYYQAPEVVFEDANGMRHWGNIAYSAARHAMLKKEA